MNTKKSSRGQIISFDLSASVVIFMLFISIFTGFFFLHQNTGVDNADEFELEYVFVNLENNLKISPKSGGSRIDFFSFYNIDTEKLNKFVSKIEDSSLDNYTIGNVGKAHGIGLDTESYDSCLFFKDTDGSFIELDDGSGNKKKAIGILKDGINCSIKVGAGKNPCDNYNQALSIFKPVLFNEGDQYKNRIVQMNILLCKN